MELKKLFEEKKYNSDKFTSHSYLEDYDRLFSPIKDEVKSILEIGIQKGESLLMWKDLFPNAEIYGAEINLSSLTINPYQDRITIKQGDAYTHSFLDLFKDINFDIIIDDGSHLVEHMEFFCKYYPKILKPGGIMIVEDIAHFPHAEQLLKSLPKELQEKAYISDLRHIKNRWDDVLLIVK